MKRPLTYKEIQDVIEMEDKCGVNTLLQEILSYTNKKGTVMLCRDIIVIGEFDAEGYLGEIEVIKTQGE